MRAAFIDALGPAESIRYGDVAEPAVGPDQVLVDVLATAVNPVDTFVRSGRYRTPMTFPFVIGRDLVGTVRSFGENVAGFSAGEAVWCNSLGHAGRQGAAAERACVPADRLYHVPPGVDPVELVAVAHPGATAALALRTHAGARAGETVFVAGAAGHVGRAAVAVAVSLGARVVGSARNTDLDAVRGLGADVALDYTDAAFPEQLRAATPDGIDVHLDTSGAHDLVLAIERLAPRGRIVLMSGFGATAEIPVSTLYVKDGSVLGFAISNASVADLAGASQMVNELAAAGMLRPRTVEVLGLDDAAEAHCRLEADAIRGTRLVLRTG